MSFKRTPDEASLTIRTAARLFITSLVAQGEITNKNVFGILGEVAGAMGYGIQYTSPSMSQIVPDMSHIRFKYEGMASSGEDG